MPQVSRGTLTSAGPHRLEEGAAKKPSEAEAELAQRPSLGQPVGEGLSEARALGESGSAPAPIAERQHERQHEEGEAEEGGEEGAEGIDGAEGEADAETAAAGGEEEFVREREPGHAGGHHRHRRHNDTGLALGDDLTADFDFDADPGMAHMARRITSAQLIDHRLSIISLESKETNPS